MLTVHDLIKKLEKLPLQSRVLIGGSYDGVPESLRGIEIVWIKPNTDDIYYYGDILPDSANKEEFQKAILIS